jgi:hypothetical protein
MTVWGAGPSRKNLPLDTRLRAAPNDQSWWKAVVAQIRGERYPTYVGKAYILLLMCAALGACSKVTPLNGACLGNGSWWRVPPGEVFERGEVGVVKLQRSGRLTFNGLPADPDTFNTYLKRLRKEPASYVRFIHEPGADCAQIEAVRNAIELKFDCEAGDCLEGTDGQPPPPPPNGV